MLNEMCDRSWASDDVIQLRVFPFSLKDRAKTWYDNLAPRSFAYWDVFAQAFISKYFPPEIVAQLMNEIHEFFQFETESLYEAWERYKVMLRKCLCHGMSKRSIVEKFYQGMNLSTRQFVDASVGGSLMNKSMDATYDLIEDMSVANCH
ncbi:hypothetical protein QYF36_002908 [Acer negundo]|nr:hypothetical protein QYF36_002908 [Acer negundo]